MSVQPLFERNQEATIYIGNVDLKVNEEILWELFIQCGPVVNVHIPRDKITGDHQGYGFVEMRSEEDADYAIKIMHMIKLYGKPIKVNKASQDKRTQEVGANIFIGNLDPEVDENMLYDTFSSFGIILSTKIMRDPDTGASKGFGFVSFDSFEAGDAALTAMNGQFFCNRTIHVSYAYKKDTKGERHGTAAERLLAANRPDISKSSYFGGLSTFTEMQSQALNMMPPTMPIFNNNQNQQQQQQQQQMSMNMNQGNMFPSMSMPMMNQQVIQQQTKNLPMNMPPLPNIQFPSLPPLNLLNQ